MEFSLTEEQNLIRQTAKEFAQNEIYPVAAQYDREGLWPEEILHKAWELGLINVTIEEEFGGPGLGVLDLVLVTEQLAWGCVGISLPGSLNALVADVVSQGSLEQKQHYLDRLIKGELGAYAVTEPGAGSDVSGIQTRAIKNGDSYIIDGCKTWISNAPFAGFFVVLVRTNPEAGHKGLSFFIVDKETPGLEIGKPIPKIGQKAGHASEVFFTNVVVPETARIGAEGDGFKIAMKAFDSSRPMVAAFALGLMQRCLDLSLEYAQERRTFGRPIYEHQAIGHKLAEIQIRLDAARLMTYQAACLADSGKRNTMQASCAKAFACDSAMYAATEAMQIFGGNGYSTEYPVEKLFRDAKVLQVYEGTSEIQRNIIVRELINR